MCWYRTNDEEVEIYNEMCMIKYFNKLRKTVFQTLLTENLFDKIDIILIYVQFKALIIRKFN